MRVDTLTRKDSPVPVSNKAKQVFAKINLRGNIEFLVSVLTKFKEQGRPNSELGWLLCDFLVTAVQNKTSDVDGIVKAVVQKYFDIGTNDVQENFRPFGVPFELSEIMQENVDFEYHPTLIPDDIVAFGPRVNTKSLGAAIEAPGDDTECGICMEQLQDDDSIRKDGDALLSVLKLDICEHMFHVACMDRYVNRCFPGKRNGFMSVMSRAVVSYSTCSTCMIYVE
jgi:hypothetical protein